MKKTDLILQYLREHGPTPGPVIMKALGLDTGACSTYAAALVIDGQVLTEKVPKPGTTALTCVYRLATKADDDSGGLPSVKQTKAVHGMAPVLEPGAFNPADPFGLAVKRLPAVEEHVTEVLIEEAPIEIVIPRLARPDAPPPVVVSPPVPSNAPVAEPATPGIVCALLSTGQFEIRAGGAVTVLTLADLRHVRDFMNKVELA